MDKFKQAMAQAAALAAEKEAHAAQVQARRAEELREVARRADLMVDGRRNRCKRAEIKINPKKLIYALQEWRMNTGFSKKQAALYLGITTATYILQEQKGRNFISKDYYEKLRQAGVDLPELEQ